MRLSIGVIKNLSNVDLLTFSSSAGISPDLKVLSILNDESLCFIPVTHQCSSPIHLRGIKGYAWQEDFADSGRYRIISLTKVNQLCLFDLHVLHCKDKLCKCTLTAMFEWDMHKISDTLQDLQAAINKATSLKIMTFCSSELRILIDNKHILTLNILIEKAPVVTSSLLISEEGFNVCHAQLVGDFIVLLNDTKTVLSVYSLINEVKCYEWDITSFINHDKLKEPLNIMFVADTDMQYIVICIGRQNIYWLKCSLRRKHVKRTQNPECFGNHRKSSITAFVKQFPSLVKVSESTRGISAKAQIGKWCHLSLPAELADMTVRDMFLLDDKLWCFCFDDISACVAVINLESGTFTISEKLKMPVIIIKASGNSGTHPFFLLGKDSISVILVDLGPEKLVNELMTYTHSGAAETLSMLNCWQSIQVDFGVLQQGLRNRQLDTVEFFLRMHVEAFRQMFAARKDTQKEEWMTQLKLESHKWDQILFLVLNTVKINMDDSSSWQFASHLLQMILSTLVSLLHIIVKNTTCSPEQPKESKMSAENDVFQLNSQLCKYLHEARHFLHGNHSKMESTVIPALLSEDINVFPLVIQDRFNSWRQKSWKEAIKDAVLNGYVTLIQAFLTLTQKENFIINNGSVLDVIISTGMEFVLEALQQGSLKSAIEMLSNMGLSVDKELVKIFKSTVYRDFRKVLLPELRKRNLLTQHDDEITSFLFVVESLYPCTSFEQTKVLYTDKSAVSYSNLLYPTSTLLSNLKFESCALNVGDLIGPIQNSSEIGAYCCLVLDWVTSWRKDVQERILTYHVLKENRHSLLPHISHQTVWQYLLEHGDLAYLKKWVKNYLGLLHDFPVEEGPFTWPIDGVMVDTVRGTAPAHIEEYILNKLGSNGIFCEEELEDISLFLQRLGHIQYDLSDNQLFLSKRSTISFPDFCHRIIHYCFQFKLFNLFHLFLSNTWNSIQSWPTCPICCKPLLSMVVAICQWSQKPEDSLLAFQAIMTSAVKFYNLSNSSLEDLRSNAPLSIFLACVLYSPLTIEKFFTSADEKSSNSTAYHSAFVPYPVLYDALFYSDRVSYMIQPDVILYQLLQGNSVFDSTRLFGWQKANILKNEEASNEMPHFSLPSLVEQYGLKEELTYIYYLLEGRPNFAYAKFIAKELTEGRLPNTTRIHSVCKEVAVLAFNHYTNHKVTSSCVLFTEMLGQDSLRLRVNLVVAMIIHAYVCNRDSSSNDTDQLETDIACWLEQSLDDRESAYHLLHLLEASLAQQCQVLQNRPCMEIALWFPAVAFSSLNHLEPVLTYLNDCAKSGDWLRFLVYSQLYQIPKEQVLKLLPEFPTTCLIDHLHNALQVKVKKKGEKPKFKSPRNIRNALYFRIGFSKAAVTSHDCSSAPEMSSDDDDDSSSPVGHSDTVSSSSENDIQSLAYARELFGQLLYCHETVSPWRSLIQVSLDIGNPILAILASCYEDSSLLSCFGTWLATSLNRNKISKSGQNNLGDNISSLWNLDDIENIMENAMRNRNITFLRQGVMLFLPDSPLLPLLNFLVAFLIHKQYDSSSTKQHLNEFQNKIERLNCTEADNCPLITPEWVEKMCAHLLTTAVILCNNSFERLLLLRCLSFSRIQNSFSPNAKLTDFNKLYLLMQHIGDIDITVSVENLILSEDEPDYIQECWQIVKTLQKFSHYNEATKFAKVAKLPIDGVIVYQLKQEADNLHNYHKHLCSPEWQHISSHLKFWEEANRTLQKNKVKTYMGAHFFKDQTIHVKSYNEKYFVMKLAVEWLNDSSLKNKDAALLSQWKEELLHLCIKAEEEREVHYKDGFGGVVTTLPLDGCLVSHKSWDFSFLASFHYAEDGLVLQIENELEKDVLRKLINKLLTTGHIGHAWHLSCVFQYRSSDLSNIMTCFKLAKKEILPRNNKKVKSNHSLPVVSKLSLECLNSEQKEVASLIEQIAVESEHAASACVRILVYYYVASILHCPFDSVVCEDPFILLKNILTNSTPDKYSIAESLIRVHSLSDNDVAEFLCKEIISLLQLCFSDSAKSSISNDKAELLYNPRRGSKGLLQLIWLCSDPSILGNKLLKAAKCETEIYQKSGAKPSLCLAVRLYAHSHDCFTVSCNMEGISKVLQKAKVMAHILSEAAEFTLLVQLLTGIGRFSEMTYVFNILMEHHHFELLFHKSMEEVPNLHLALLDYFKRHPPSDSDYYSMLAFTFNSFREIAEISESRAHHILNSIMQNYGNPLMREQLQSATQFLSSASDSYSKANCVRHAQKCANHAKLVALQLSLLHTDTWLIKLKDEEVHLFISKHKKFIEALIVAEAYEWHQSWSQAIYYNVVENGDWNYFREYETCLGFSSHLVEEVAKKFHHSIYKTENSIKNMRRLLNLWSNVELKYKLAINMGFHDIAKDLLKGEKSAYLQDLLFT